MEVSNLSRSGGTRGVRAPGERVTSLGARGEPLVLSGSSVAAPFVTGVLALLWSMFPGASASELRHAATSASVSGRRTLVPPLLNAKTAYQHMVLALRPFGG
jgi:subtilisin family serine protease